MKQRYPHATAIRWDAYSVVAAWALLAVCVLLVVLGVLVSQSFFYTVIPVFKVFVAVAAVRLGLAFTHKCPICGKRPTVQGFTPVHPASIAQSKLSGWAGVVARVVVGGPFVCIHCGTEFSLNEPRA
jgi:hypothetical protein